MYGAGSAKFSDTTPYLLTGFTECSICNGAIGGITQFHGSGPVENRKRATFYGCNFHRKRGDHVCDNDVVLRTEAIDHAVLDGISAALEDWITSQAIDAALENLRAGHEPHLDRRAQVERELSLVETRLSRIVEAITSGGTLDTLVAQLRAEEARKKELVAELEAYLRRLALLRSNQRP